MDKNTNLDRNMKLLKCRELNINSLSVQAGEEIHLLVSQGEACHASRNDVKLTIHFYQFTTGTCRLSGKRNS